LLSGDETLLIIAVVSVLAFTLIGLVSLTMYLASPLLRIGFQDWCTSFPADPACRLAKYPTFLTILTNAFGLLYGLIAGACSYISSRYVEVVIAAVRAHVVKCVLGQQKAAIPLPPGSGTSNG
jgi:hypothetical protein